MTFSLSFCDWKIKKKGRGKRENHDMEDVSNVMCGKGDEACRTKRKKSVWGDFKA